MQTDSRRNGAIILCGLLAAWTSFSAPASAVTLAGFKGQGFERIYGSYAPRGDCSLEPQVTVDELGFTFKSKGRTVKSTKFEYAASYMGPDYEGIATVFFPFPINDNDFGRLILMVNDGERPGTMRLDPDLMPGQAQDPFQAALTKASPLALCKGTAKTTTAVTPAPKPAEAASVAMPLEWKSLPSLVGKYPGSLDLLAGSIGSAIKSQLGPRIAVLKKNLSVSSALQRQGSLYYLSGNAEHQGGVEQAYLLIDGARRAVQIGLWEMGKLTVYGPAGSRIPLPLDLRKLVNDSPPDDAVALPGTPWEVVPVQGRPPMAYVDAAGSPDIKSFSVFCEGSRPTMAMLLNKPVAGNTITVTWNFAGGPIDVPVARSNSAGTFWQAYLINSPLISMLMRQKGSAMLRLNHRLEGEALLTGAPASLRSALKSCLRL